MPKRILLADDSAAARTSVEQALGTADYQIITAEDGRSAMEQINGANPHLVLVHAMLPEIDGYEVCRKVKETPETSHIPVLLLTGTFEPFDINRAKEVRYDGFVTKPPDGSDLLALVSRCIDNAVYPADPVPVEAPEAEEDPAVEVAESADATPESGAGNGSDAMLDRIFPEESRGEPDPDAETVIITESTDDDLFSIVESSEPVSESIAEAADEAVHSQTSGSAGFGIWGGSGETVAEDAAEEVQPAETEANAPDTQAADEDAGESKPDTAEEDSDLSWFLRKYEEKQQSADVDGEAPPADALAADATEELSGTAVPEPAPADPFTIVEEHEAEDEAVPAVEELTMGDAPEPDMEQQADPGQEAVEPLPADSETPAEELPAHPVLLDDRQIEKISRRVVELLSDNVVRDVAWEAVPEIAERLIRERIQEIEAGAETSD